jgi:two-component system, OmpR family, response regulator RpaB
LTTPKTVLVVDDEVHIRRVLELKLKINGYQVITASNGREALKIINTSVPDAVITDINMPDMDGKQLCLEVDGLKELKPFLTIVITARISTDEENWIQPLRDVRFVEKPFSPSKIIEKLDQYFAATQA